MGGTPEPDGLAAAVGEEIRVIVEVTRDPPVHDATSEGPLASTGASIAVLVAIAVVLLAIGLLVRRPHRPHRPEERP